MDDNSARAKAAATVAAATAAIEAVKRKQAAKAEKDKATAGKAKALQAAAEERAVKNFQANMKKAGRPIPKPTPIVIAVAPPVPATPVKPGAVPSTAASAKAPEVPAKK